MAKSTGRKITFARETTPGSGTYTLVADVKTITLPGVERATADTTTLNDDVETVIGALAKWGEIEVVGYLDPASTAQLDLESSVSDPTTIDGESYRVTYPAPGSETFTFTAVPTSFVRSPKTTGEALTFTFKAKVSGSVVMA